MDARQRLPDNTPEEIVTSSNNLSSGEFEVYDEESSSSQDTVSSNSTSSEEDPFKDALISALNQITAQYKTSKDDDEDELFLKYILHAMKRMDGKNKTQFKALMLSESHNAVKRSEAKRSEAKRSKRAI